MKKYMINMVAKNGQTHQFKTDTNVLHLKPINVNGAKMIMTKDQLGINLGQVKKLEVVQVGHGKIGEIVNG